MSIFGERSTERRLVKLEQEAGDSHDTSGDVLQRQINELNLRLTPSGIPTTPTAQGILNMLRNTDHPHSVNTWWEAAPSGTDKDKECANVYAYPGFNPITITDATIGAGSTDLVSLSGPFTAAMNGRYAIVPGAGAAGADLVATMTFVSATHATLSIAATLGVGPVTARINLLKLTHTNKKNAAGTNPSDALKDSSHSNYGSNIQDPDWSKTLGIVRIGSTNIAGYPFGRFDNTGLIYVPLNQLFAGREPFFRVNIARANPYVKIRGRLFIGIYNNNEAVLDWVKGANLTPSPVLSPNPPATEISTDYIVVLETGQGFTIISDVVTVTHAPDDNAMNGGAVVHLSWTYYAGVIRATVYRRRAAGNVFKMETFSTGANNWTDTNLSTRTDTGSAAFPTFANQISAIPSYWASSDHEFDDLLYDGEPGRFWKPITGHLPFSSSVNMSRLFDPHFIIGLSTGLSTYLTDAVTDGTATVTSAAGQFTAAMTGKTYELIKSDGSASVTGTVTFVDAHTITVSAAPAWSEAGSKLEILDSQPHGLLYDLVGCSLNEGAWAYNPEDNSELRGQNVASQPPSGSTQGGIGGQDPTDRGGRGGVDCVLDSSLVSVRGTRRSSWIWEWITS
jgi:hypothetical protein